MSQDIPHADLIRAALDGKVVEHTPSKNEPWIEFNDATTALSLMINYPQINYPHWQYRIKPKPETKEQALEALQALRKPVSRGTALSVASKA